MAPVVDGLRTAPKGAGRATHPTLSEFSGGDEVVHEALRAGGPGVGLRVGAAGGAVDF